MSLYKLCQKIVKFLFMFVYRVEIYGKENIPKHEGAIISPNHFHWMDPIVVGVYIDRQIRFMAKYELFNNKLLNKFLKKLGAFPVRRHEADLNAVKTALKLLKEDNLVGLFPEGTRSKTGELGEANAGVAMFSIKSAKPVIPVCIIGNYKPFTKIIIKIGQPIDFTQYKKEKMSNSDYLELSQIVMNEIKKLKEGM
ncbi:lysophospholipid acyltransferase family protein [Thermobrachium celere]|uniref:1-acyl-sn-glycerol-3-phosphate acyltransferase n=1 Tax=Thermobrachium celere DSM 8682 TaxID=941824 RepID=R7RQ34_9CLOT|nr:lysophospholipid acyltransferase family protein [Thermobrachium celere]CDF58164.1 1-acyl-sn-glycerol-3-phosphate acyltransferase [Thermobrachium celere DSM 8682]